MLNRNRLMSIVSFCSIQLDTHESHLDATHLLLSGKDIYFPPNGIVSILNSTSNSSRIRLSTPIRRSLPKIVPGRERLRRRISRAVDLKRPRSRGNSGNADPGWRAVFVTFISRQVRANIAHFLPEFGCNARIIRIELEGGSEGGT